MKKIPLNDWHVSHGAKMVEFGGFLMPVSYSGVLAEHQAVRERCGLFDISHMGEFYFEGEAAQAFLQSVTTNDLRTLHDGEAQYSLLLNETGGVVDDIIVYRINATRFMLCVNAANIQKDFAWLRARLPQGLSMEDRSDEMGMIALQGPASERVLAAMDFDLESLQRFQFSFPRLAENPVMLSRTGYTGEEGCEIFLPNESLPAVWEALLRAGAPHGIVPIGLGARDTLRLEMAYPLYGHELNDEINPFEAGLAWVVKMEKGDFVGRPALQKIQAAGVARRRVGLAMLDPGIPREGLRVILQDRPVGVVCSGTFSPTLKVGIATALIDRTANPDSGEILIDIRGKLKKAKIVQLPFIKRL